MFTNLLLVLEAFVFHPEGKHLMKGGRGCGEGLASWSPSWSSRRISLSDCFATSFRTKLLLIVFVIFFKKMVYHEAAKGIGEKHKRDKPSRDVLYVYSLQRGIEVQADKTLHRSEGIEREKSDETRFVTARNRLGRKLIKDEAR